MVGSASKFRYGKSNIGLTRAVMVFFEHRFWLLAPILACREMVSELRTAPVVLGIPFSLHHLYKDQLRVFDGGRRWPIRRWGVTLGMFKW